MRDAGCGMRGCKMRDAACGMRDARCGMSPATVEPQRRAGVWVRLRLGAAVAAFGGTCRPTVIPSQAGAKRRMPSTGLSLLVRLAFLHLGDMTRRQSVLHRASASLRVQTELGFPLRRGLSLILVSEFVDGVFLCAQL